MFAPRRACGDRYVQIPNASPAAYTSPNCRLSGCPPFQKPSPSGEGAPKGRKRSQALGIPISTAIRRGNNLFRPRFANASLGLRQRPPSPKGEGKGSLASLLNKLPFVGMYVRGNPCGRSMIVPTSGCITSRRSAHRAPACRLITKSSRDQQTAQG